MRKISTFLFFFIFTHTVSISQCSLTVNSFPYTQGFESGAGSWTSGGTGNDWAMGTPSKAFITSAGSGTKCWVTGGLSGSFYTNGERSYVMSPCFDFTSLSNPVISCKVFWESENTYDGATLQSSINNGTTWINVGSDTDPTDCMTQNWFNNSGIINLATLANPKSGWAGSSMPTSGSCQGGGGSNGWVLAKHCLSNLAGQSSVRFRFAFGAGTSCNNFDGFAFDDVKIENAPSNTANFSYACTLNSLQYQFTNTSTVCPNNFVWNFGDPASGVNNGTGAQNPLHIFSSPGTYTVTLTVSGPCNSTPATITKIISTLGMNISSTNLPCSNSSTGSVNASVLNNQGISTYQLQPGSINNTSGNFSNLPPGTYTVMVTDAIGCSTTSSVTISSPSALNWTSFSVTPISCNGLHDGKIIGLCSGGTGSMTYQLNPTGVINSTGTFMNLSAGVYTVIASDANGCSVSTTSTIIDPNPITLLSATQQNVQCNGANNGSILVNYIGGTSLLTYQLSPGAVNNTNGSFTNLSAGVYSIVCTDINGCSKNSVYTILEPTLLRIDSISIGEPSCSPNNNGTATVHANGGTSTITFSIGGNFGNNNSFSGMTSGSYTVIVKDGNGCLASSIIVLQSLNAPLFTSVVENDETCADSRNGSILVSASGHTAIQQYVLSPSGSINSNGNFSSLSAGSYIITVTDADGCTNTSSAIVHSPDKLSIDQLQYQNDSCGSNESNKLICFVSGGTGNYSYQINPGNIIQNQDIFSNLGIGNYTITIKDANLCSANSTVTIPEKICCDGVFLPNAFTPNNDGRNDEFALKGVSGIELNDFLIFNRWGEVVFKGQNLFDSWNGHYKGADAEMGTYYYLVRYRCLSSNKLYTLKGDVILIR